METIGQRNKAKRAAYKCKMLQSTTIAAERAAVKLKAGQEAERSKVYAGPEKIDRSSPHVIASRTTQGPVTQTWGKPEVTRTVAKHREYTTGSCPHWMPTESKRTPATYDVPKARWNMARGQNEQL